MTRALARPGQICAVQVNPAAAGPIRLQIIALDRESGTPEPPIVFERMSLLDGVALALNAGRTYTFTLHLPPGGGSRVRVTLRDKSGDESIVVDQSLGGPVQVVVITVTGSQSAGTGPSRDQLGGRRMKPPGRSATDRTSFEAARAETPRARAPVAVVPPKRNRIQTGFSTADKPERAVSSRKPLALGGDYYFWLQVGAEDVRGAIDVNEEPLDVRGLDEGAQLDVVLFAFEGAFALEPGGDRGVLEAYGAEDARGERAVRVARRAAEPAGLRTRALLDRRLFFRVRMPKEPGTHHLRCNVYFRHVLLQSRLVSIDVARAPKAQRTKVLATTVDYRISALDPTVLKAIEPHVLSVMLNDNGNGTHGFRFYGGDAGGEPFKSDASISDGELTAKIRNARRQLREVAWGSPEKWQPGVHEYRYWKKPQLSALRKDLINLARAGFRLYDHLATRLAAQPGSDALEREQRWALEALMRRSGRVQIASKVSANHVVPAAMLFDHAFADGEGDDGRFRLCPAFERALTQGAGLLGTPCFTDACAGADDPHVVCPSGFWGFRHQIGFPTMATRDADPSIPFEDKPSVLVSVSTDARLEMRATHEVALRKLVGDTWLYADDTPPTYALMKADRAQVVYFYCHGGLHATDNSPYLEVGPSRNPQVITRGELNNARILWKKHPPLVFINGCHTTAVEPEASSDLVSGFRECNAVGVIGTEITIFEPLAAAFAERFFQHFLGGMEVGKALRLSRIHLLEQWNPLGLVYIPFVLASVTLRERAS